MMAGRVEYRRRAPHNLGATAVTEEQLLELVQYVKSLKARTE